MIRFVGAVVIISIVASCGSRSGPASLPEAPRPEAALDEAARLAKLVETLRGAGKYQEATAPAERSLRLRENALGPAHLDVASSLSQLGLLDLDQGAYDKAAPLLIRALDLREKALGATHPEVAQSLNSLAELYRAQGKYGNAEALHLRALDLREKALGPSHPEVATSLYNLAELHRTQGAHDKAEPLHVRALEIRERVLGPLHPEVAISLTGVATLYSDQGAYGKAEPLYVRALDIAEKALGPLHPEVARILNRLGKLHRLRGAYDTAEPLHIRALDIAERALGPMHPDVAQDLSDFAAVYWARGAYNKAEALYVRALDIREKALGPMHPDVARSLNNLALVSEEQGAYGKAEQLYIRALDIAEKLLGPAHPHVATILNNLAIVYWGEGAYGDAERLLVRTLDILEKALGPMHADVGQSLNNLAILQHIQGNYQESERLHVRALEIAEKTLGPTHPDVALALNNLAWFYRDQKLYRKAEPLMVRALDIAQKALGPAHPRGALAMQSLATLYRDQGAYGKAEPLMLRSLDIFEKALGPMHPDVANGLRHLALLYWAQGTYEKAQRLLARATEIREAQLRVELPRLSEPRKRALMTGLQEETDDVVSLHAHAMPRSAPALEVALTTLLRRKGRVLDSLVDNETTLRAHLTPPLRDQLDELDRTRTELVARLYASRDAIDRAAVAAVRTRIEGLEAALSAASADFGVQSTLVTVVKIQAALPPDAALVELVRYQRFDPRQGQRSQEDRYAAYLVTRHGPLQWVALGAASAIDAQVDAVLATMDDKVSAATATAALRRLDALVLAPIRARLTGISHLILAPDGKLNLVPFDALVDARGHHALETYLVSYVTTGRDLLRFAATPQPRSAAVIVASPDYGPPLASRSTVSFTPLRNALGEASDLQRYFPTPPLTGDKATKSALKALVGPAMVHVATHGFYAQNRGTKRIRARGNPSREMFGGRASPLPPPARSEDPADGLDRAGLAMAGANQGPGGILTAREVAGFDWWGTQLVVLSACETGVGAVPSGDGVYGMRRALVLAGVASQLLSLWMVDDSSTRELMRDYYAELARGTGRADALRQAQLRLMRQPRYAHPRYWAAFIPAGDWKPLAKGTMPQQRFTH